MTYPNKIMTIILLGTIGIAIANPPTYCVCVGGFAPTGCTTAGCSIGDDTACTHGYSYAPPAAVLRILVGRGFGCACPGYSSATTTPYFDSNIDDADYNGGTTPFASCDAFGNIIGGSDAAGATACCNYCCTPPGGD